MKKPAVLFSILFLLLCASPVFAAFFRSSNSFTASFTVLGEDDGGVWFGGFYFGAVALRFDRKSETWETYFQPVPNVRLESKVVRANGYLFFGDELALFDEKKREWRQPGSIPPPTEPVDDLRAFYGAGEASSLPPLAFQVYKKHFAERIAEKTNAEGHFDPKEYEFEQKTISPVKIGRKTWFGITFYSGEGITGVGGVGFYDERQGKTGILRLPELIQCSVKSLTAEGAVLRIEQVMNTEAGEYSCGPPLYLNTETGDITIHTIPQHPGLHWEMIHSMKRTGNERWFSMDAGLLRIMANGTWNLYALDRVSVRQETPAYSDAGSDASVVRVKPGDYRLLWSAYGFGRGSSRGYLEVAAGYMVRGWTYYTAYCQKKEPESFLIEAEQCPLRKDPSTDAPSVGSYGPGPLKIIEERDGWQKIEGDGVWIPAEAALLRPRLSLKGGGYTETRVPWRFTDPIEKVMFQTANEERIAAEAEHKPKPTPVPPVAGSPRTPRVLIVIGGPKKQN